MKRRPAPILCRKTTMTPTPLIALAALAAVLGAPALAQGLPAARPTLDCMIQPHQIVQVGSPAAGVIDKILVDRGDLVKPGQVLVQLQAGVERAALAVARERAAQQGEMTVAAGSSELAQRELQRAKELHQQNFVSQTYLDKQRAEAAVAGGRTDQATERRKLAHREVDLAAAQLAQRSIAAPIGGVVVERFMSPGEFVDQKPILRLAAIDPLRVDVLVPATAFGQIEPGRQAAVLPELVDRKEHVAVVKTVDRVIDAATNTFRVRLELPNPGGALPAGLRCKVDLGLKLPAPAAAATPPAPPLLARQ
jgi:RND family efflux transporter MFP subunit